MRGQVSDGGGDHRRLDAELSERQALARSWLVGAGGVLELQDPWQPLDGPVEQDGALPIGDLLVDLLEAQAEQPAEEEDLVSLLDRQASPSRCWSSAQPMVCLSARARNPSVILSAS